MGKSFQKSCWWTHFNKPNIEIFSSYSEHICRNNALARIVPEKKNKSHKQMKNIKKKTFKNCLDRTKRRNRNFCIFPLLVLFSKRKICNKFFCISNINIMMMKKSSSEWKMDEEALLPWCFFMHQSRLINKHLCLINEHK